MQQMKFFKGLEDQLPELEQEVNAWIRQSGVEVLHLSGNIAPQSPKPADATGGSARGRFPPSDVIVIVTYETET